MVKSQASASSARLRLASAILRVSIITAWGGRGWTGGTRHARSDIDEVVFVRRVVCEASCAGEVKYGLAEDANVDLGGDLDEDVLFTLWRVDQVADVEGDVSGVVCFVLFEDHIAPGLVEVSGCHVASKV
jgi:hypothetical protein